MTALQLSALYHRHIPEDLTSPLTLTALINTHDLAAAFELSTHDPGTGDWRSNARVLHLYGGSGRSSTHGDVVVIGKNAYQAGPNGFEHFAHARRVHGRVGGNEHDRPFEVGLMPQTNERAFRRALMPCAFRLPRLLHQHAQTNTSDFQVTLHPVDAGWESERHSPTESRWV